MNFYERGEYLDSAGYWEEARALISELAKDDVLILETVTNYKDKNHSHFELFYRIHYENLQFILLEENLEGIPISDIIKNYRKINEESLQEAARAVRLSNAGKNKQLKMKEGSPVMQKHILDNRDVFLKTKRQYLSNEYTALMKQYPIKAKKVI